jgi:hypothetical protein
MGKMCLVHKTAPASVMCFQCHKPICAECVIMTASGSFCSMECDLTYRTFKAGMSATGKRRKLALILLVIVIVITLIALGFGAGWIKSLIDAKR